MKNGFQWLRLVTPLLVTICLFYIQDIRTNVVKIEERVRSLENRMMRIETILKVGNGKKTSWEKMSRMPKILSRL